MSEGPEKWPRMPVEPDLHRHAKTMIKRNGMKLYALQNRALRLGFEAMGVPCPEHSARAQRTRKSKEG